MSNEPKRLYFLQNRYLGESRATPQLVHNEMHEAQTISFCCPMCNEIWFTAFIKGTKAHFVTVPCEHHSTPYRLDPPGSIWLTWEDAYLGDLPQGLLQRELFLWAKWIEDWNTYTGKDLIFLLQGASS